MGASRHHSFTQYLVTEGAAAPLALNLIMGAVPGRRCYETTLSIRGGKKSSASFNKFGAFLGGHEVLSSS